ncbi:MAG TPA: CoA-binding protein [Actinobacteria bacterium]|jgi:predicted CoA-binding protein|nr:CoA-binding protein [Actinomycetota bacterium]
MNTPEEIVRVLAMPTWFIVGLGDNPDRDAYWVALALQQRGRRIIPIHPRAQVVHGDQGFATIAAAARTVGAPDVVDVFVRSSRAGEFADQAIEAGAKAVWFQIGVLDESAAARVEDAGLVMVMDRCPKIELGRHTVGTPPRTASGQDEGAG